MSAQNSQVMQNDDWRIGQRLGLKWRARVWRQGWQFLPALILALAILTAGFGGPAFGKWQAERQAAQYAAIASVYSMDPLVGGKEKGMAVYELTGGGSDVNAADYARVTDTWGTGKNVYYSPSKGMYLYWQAGAWYVNTAVNASWPDYQNTSTAKDPDPPLTTDAAWTVNYGVSPAPTVTLAVTTYSITGSVLRWGAAHSGVLVTATKGALTHTATTDGSGAFTITGCEDDPSVQWYVVPSLSAFNFRPTGRYRTVNGADADAGVFRSASDANHSISGIVTSGGSPLVGVLMSAVTAPGGINPDSEQTAGDGTYTLIDRVEGRHLVVPALGGSAFDPWGRNLLVIGADVTGVDFEEALPGRIITGSVRDASGNPIPGAAVVATATGETNVTATTDADGHFSLAGCADGKTWTVSATKATRVITPTSIPVAVSGSDVAGVDFTAQFHVSGQVTLSAAPCAGATLTETSEGKSAESQSDGNYLILLDTAGDKTVVCYLSGYTATPTNRTFTLVDEGLTGQDFALSVATIYNVTCRVTNAGVPVPGVTVSAALHSGYGGGDTNVTGGGGTCVLHLSADEYDFTAYGIGDLTFSGPYTVTISADTEIDFVATALFTVSGRVTYGGIGLPGVLLTAAGGYFAYTGPDGSFIFSGLPPGPTPITPALTLYTFTPTTRTPLVVGPLTGVDFSATLAPVLHAVSGTVSGDVAGGVRISAGAYVTYTAGDGTWTLHLPDGAYTITPDLPAYTFAPTTSAQTVSGAPLTGVDFVSTLVVGGYDITGHVALGAGNLGGVGFTLGGFTYYSLADGTYTIPALAPGTYRLTPVKVGYTFSAAYLDVTITSGNQTGKNFTATAVGDTTAPVVTILTPADAATLTGDTSVTWAAIDAVGVVVCRVLIDSNLQATIDPGLAYSWEWLLSGWSNGDHVIRVEADDAASNTGYDEITVTVARSLASSTVLFITKPLPLAGMDGWDLVSRTPELGLATAVVIQELPADPAERYNCTLGVNRPGASRLWADYQPVLPDRSFAFLGTGPTLAWALLGQPQVVWSFGETAAAASFLRAAPLPTGWALLAPGSPPALYVADADLAVSLRTELPLTTVRDLAVGGGKIYVAGDDQLRVEDLDANDLAFSVSFPGATDVDAVALAGNLVLVATNGTTPALYSFSFDSTRKLCDLPTRANRITVSGATVYLAGQDGQVYQLQNGAAVALHDTAEAAVNQLLVDGTTLWALTGSGGKLFRSAPSWTLDNTFATTELNGAAVYDGDLWLAGNDNKLWRLTDGVWTNWYQLTGVTGVYDVQATADALYLAAAHSAGARLYRLEIAPGGGFVSGPDLPDLACGPVRFKA